MIEFKNEEKLKNEINRIKTITNIISLGSIILALNVIVWAICFITLDNALLYGIVFGVSFLVFVIYLFSTYKFYKELAHKNNLKKVYLSHNLRRNKEYSKFFDTGSDLIEKEDYKDSDLDLFGKNSLFQYLSIAKTKYGRLKLKDALTTTNKKDKDYTDTIYKMANDENILNVEATLSQFKNESKTLDYDTMYTIFENKIKFKPIFILPLLSFIGTIVYLILVLSLGFNPYYLFIFGIANFILCKLCLINDVFGVDSTKYFNLIESYYDLSNEIINLNIDTKYITNLKEESLKSKIHIKKLKSTLNILSTRKNILFNIISNVLFSFDFFVILLFNKKTQSITNLKDYFNLVGELECMMSLANIGMDNEIYCIPTLGETKGVDMYHPLIKNCIPNTFNLSSGVILTGSNMSGKTTFMRTLGICQTLFNACGLVPAKSFSSNYLDIYTSLRANDMLQEGISTFYAEILRMKKINNAIKDNKCLILIDEIFKGTNAKDRITASLKVIEKLNNNNQLFIITTHDFELCEAEGILNYHFNEEYNDDKISFDYQIKPGKCETKNAIYLLKMADII
ncbi:MAG: hypothetical protein IKP77_03455 [Acholeplasmatales bacterium]|nr:hypothetical protein [Acholeplasmatales bacterium]